MPADEQVKQEDREAEGVVPPVLDRAPVVLGLGRRVLRPAHVTTEILCPVEDLNRIGVDESDSCIFADVDVLVVDVDDDVSRPM
jgi:hypothetical protein